MTQLIKPAVLSLLFMVGCVSTAGGQTSPYYKIQVVDAETGRGVPLVELTTVNHVRYLTDSAGVVAVNEPGLMGQRIYFHIKSHGYEYPADGFGYRGVRLTPVGGQSTVIKIQRKNVAERLYRMTGAGIYRDSVLCGDTPPTRQPVLNGQVFGSDSVVNAVFRGKVYWFWGDTNRPSYPLGNFHVPGATSELPGQGGLSPEQGVDLTYFVGDQGFAKPTCQMPGKGPTWINGLSVIGEGDSQRMFATYVKVKPPLQVYERGLVEFDTKASEFKQVAVFPEDAVVFPGGHPLHHSVEGQDYVYFTRAYPWLRVVADATAFTDLSRYQSYSYLSQGSRPDELAVDRDAAGRLQSSWKFDTVPLTTKIEQRLVRDGVITKQERRMPLRVAGDAEQQVQIHGASVYWNDYRNRWVMIALQAFGSSALGEIWYSEAEQLEGPWSPAVKVVSHDQYSFYNPKQHPMLVQGGGRYVFFEGTYTKMFSGNPDATPWYNYNQIMYRLDLDKIPRSD